ncbi:acylglycerol lipase, partial [Phenoliferia sp. Uapishka_3]
MSTSLSAWMDGPEKTSFYTKTWTPSEVVGVKASVLFVHGFAEHIDRYNHVFDKFAEEGIAVFSFDGRGFGQTGAKSKTPGRTAWPLQLADISFFLKHASTLHPSVPLYLCGHSMGGGLSLAFATRSPPSPGLELIKGVIASSPLLRQGAKDRAPKLIVRAGSIIGKISGSLTLKAEVKPENISRDVNIQKAYAADPLCVPTGTFRGVANMLLGGEALVTEDYKKWPLDLPLFIVHGSADPVCDYEASQFFVEEVMKLGAKDASFQGFEGELPILTSYSKCLETFADGFPSHPTGYLIEPDRWVEIAALTGWIKSKI